MWITFDKTQKTLDTYSFFEISNTV